LADAEAGAAWAAAVLVLGADAGPCTGDGFAALPLLAAGATTAAPAGSVAGPGAPAAAAGVAAVLSAGGATAAPVGVTAFGVDDACLAPMDRAPQADPSRSDNASAAIARRDPDMDSPSGCVSC
jgi:hypothetical protein